MSDGKMMAGLYPEMKGLKAVQLVLAARLETVQKWLPLASDPEHKDPEAVHQLRVSTRRASAALLVFRDCFRKKSFRKLKSILRTIRRCVGGTRDWDVFIQILAQSRSLRQVEFVPTLTFLLGIATANRMQCQQNVWLELPEQASLLVDFTSNLNQAIDEEADCNQEPVIHRAENYLQKWIQAIENATTPLPKENPQLHAIRIQGKRLRYGMELFVDCFDLKLKELLYPKIEQMQEILGNINDSVGIVERMTTLSEVVKTMQPREWLFIVEGMNSFIQAHRKKISSEKQKFSNWLKGWRVLMQENPISSLKLSFEAKSAPRENLVPITN